MERFFPVVVVGGGVFGCAAAYELARRSVEVLLIDKQLPGRATSASAGGLWPLGEAVGLGCGVIHHAAQADGASRGSRRPPNFERRPILTNPTLARAAQGGEAPRPLPEVFRDFLLASNDCFPQLAAALLEESGVDIEYSLGRGLLFAIYDERERALVDAVAASMPSGAQLEILSPREMARLEPKLGPDFLGGALLAGEHQVNPMLLAEAYKRAAIRRGACFRGDGQVTGLRRRGDRVVGVELGDEFIAAQTVVNAAGCWAAKLAATCGLRLPVFPVRGQIVLTEALPSELSICLSTSQCYLLQKPHGEVLIGSTTERAGFDTGVTETAIRSLCSGALRAVPSLRHVRAKRVWSGLRPGTPDEMPFLGPMEGVSGYFNATGGFRTGIVAAPLTGKVVAESIIGSQPCFPIRPFHADRLSLKIVQKYG